MTGSSAYNYLGHALNSFWKHDEEFESDGNHTVFTVCSFFLRAFVLNKFVLQEMPPNPTWILSMKCVTFGTRET